jgi:hypothetical protein
MKKDMSLIVVLIVSLSVNADVLRNHNSNLMAAEDPDVGHESLAFTDLLQVGLADADPYGVELSGSDTFAVTLEDCLWKAAAGVDGAYDVETSVVSFDAVAEEMLFAAEPEMGLNLDGLLVHK